MAQMVTRPVPHGSAEFRFPAVTPPPRCPTGAPVCRPPPPGPLSLVIQPPTRHPAEPGSRRDSGRTDAAPAPTSSVLRGKPSPQVTTISDGGGSLAEDPQGGTAQSGAISSVVGKGHRESAVGIRRHRGQGTSPPPLPTEALGAEIGIRALAFDPEVFKASGRVPGSRSGERCTSGRPVGERPRLTREEAAPWAVTLAGSELQAGWGTLRCARARACPPPGMRALRAALALSLLGTLRAFPQDRALAPTCTGDPSRYYDRATGQCCYRCLPGSLPAQSCPQGPSDCRKKQCDPEHYVDESGYCLACVSCFGDLVEKVPCSWNSSRMCECRPGMFCKTSAAYSCARCQPHSPCSEGKVITALGTAERDTVCDWPSPGTSLDCASPEACRIPTRGATRQAKPTEVSPATADARTPPQGGDTPPRLEDAPQLRPTAVPGSPFSVAELGLHPGVVGGDTTLEPPALETHPGYSPPANSKAPASTRPTQSPLMGSPTSLGPPVSTSTRGSLPSTGRPILDPGPVLFWVIMVLAVVLGSGSFVLCYRRACRARIRQKLHLCYPTQTVRPGLEPADSRARRNLMWPRSDVPGTEPGTEALSVAGPQVVETCANVGAASPENLLLLDASPAGDEVSPRDPPEPRVSTEHTNNRIEKIYIMKADTVIVGSVKTELPEGRGPAVPELETDLEVDQASHYPEQETEPPLDSCGDVMFSVEEEGKEDPWLSAK
nr:tumor necrosis factor receptor superfamily member 8 [Cavia porcellus]